MRKVAASKLPDTVFLFKASIELLLMAISKNTVQSSEEYIIELSNQIITNSKNLVQSSETCIIELSNQIIIWMQNVHGTEPIESEIMNELKVMLYELSLIVISC